MQRVRLALPYLRACGWEPVVLAIAPESIEGGVHEPLLETTYPADIRVVRVKGISPKITRRLGVGSLWLRCGRALRLAGDRLLGSEKFDLVFFSTTQFDAFNLGPRWKRRFGVPYVLDYQDPWVNGYYKKTNTRPPGGYLKFGFSQWRAHRQEPLVLREASGIIAVSAAYGRTLAEAHPWFAADSVRLIPFGAAVADITAAHQYRPAKPLITFGDGNYHHVYAGRCGPDMTISLTAIFRGFKRYLEQAPKEATRMRFHFIGTDYAPPPLGREWAMPIARAEGIEEYVREHCYRVPYFEALHYITQADGLLAVGSSDPTYSASKIFGYILAQRPMLILFHESSSVLSFARQAECGQLFSFASNIDIDALSSDICATWFVGGKHREIHAVNKAAFRPFTAQAMTEALVRCFDAAVNAQR